MSNDEIIRLIGKIRERYDQVHESSGNIVRIEVDLLKADIRELYERISWLTQPGFVDAIPQSQNSEPEAIEEEGPVLAEPVLEPASASIPAREVLPEVAEWSLSPEPMLKMDTTQERDHSPLVPETKQQYYPPDPIPEPGRKIEVPGEAAPDAGPQAPLQHSAGEPASSAHIQEPSAPKHATLDLFGAPAVTLADKFRDEKRSINERLNVETATDKSIGSKLRLKIADLRSAIGINDRFIFINELFEGDMRMYDEMMGRLDSCASLREAEEVFDHARAVQGWPEGLSSVERLLDFIHRRYA